MFKFKRWLTLMLALILTVTAIPIPALADNDTESGGSSTSSSVSSRWYWANQAQGIRISLVRDAAHSPTGSRQTVSGPYDFYSTTSYVTGNNKVEAWFRASYVREHTFNNVTNKFGYQDSNGAVELVKEGFNSVSFEDITYQYVYFPGLPRLIGDSKASQTEIDNYFGNLDNMKKIVSKLMELNLQNGIQFSLTYDEIVADGGYYLMLEPIGVTWANIENKPNETLRVVLTATDAAAYNMLMNSKGEYSVDKTTYIHRLSSFIPGLTHSALPVGLYIEGDYAGLGLSAPSDSYIKRGSGTNRLTPADDSTTINTGAGLGLVWFNPPRVELQRYLDLNKNGTYDEGTDQLVTSEEWPFVMNVMGFKSYSINPYTFWQKYTKSGVSSGYNRNYILTTDDSGNPKKYLLDSSYLVSKKESSAVWKREDSTFTPFKGLANQSNAVDTIWRTWQNRTETGNAVNIGSGQTSTKDTTFKFFIGYVPANDFTVNLHFVLDDGTEIQDTITKSFHEPFKAKGASSELFPNCISNNLEITYEGTTYKLKNVSADESGEDRTLVNTEDYNTDSIRAFMLTEYEFSKQFDYYLYYDDGEAEDTPDGDIMTIKVVSFISKSGEDIYKEGDTVLESIVVYKDKPYTGNTKFYLKKTTFVLWQYLSSSDGKKYELYSGWVLNKEGKRVAKILTVGDSEGGDTFDQLWNRQFKPNGQDCTVYYRYVETDEPMTTITVEYEDPDGNTLQPPVDKEVPKVL